MGSGANLGPRQKATEDGALALLANLVSTGEEQVGREPVGNMPSNLLGEPHPQAAAPPYFRALSLEVLRSVFSS